ncbi:hypothetical protein CALVIDRAFT_144848 [Calocera viscosa TUFC12733]|uniref:Uncharacterized protein n=1 Tax=Calocera viscosa (strain TUFC12733) TaxID=1330018 RepID=A0A167LSG6_CALVF|nr:hypothetical protein CALVIDRAFT_144848 [Calocera viscosa TUFC12733]
MSANKTASSTTVCSGRSSASSKLSFHQPYSLHKRGYTHSMTLSSPWVFCTTAVQNLFRNAQTYAISHRSRGCSGSADAVDAGGAFAFSPFALAWPFIPGGIVRTRSTVDIQIYATCEGGAKTRTREPGREWEALARERRRHASRRDLDGRL